ncbi:MAG: ABC transporter ATP-binding protein [Gemmobacter sp.]|nr:ABC transporter ATP-binding protein [Gemmobacter sp.]
MLEVKGLSVSYGQHRALEGAALRVARGEIVVILGANGAGKSTLLKAISGICEGKVAGSVTLQGTELLGMPAHRIVEEGIALVPEGRGVFGDLTVAENLTLGAHPSRARDEAAGNMDRVLRLFPKLSERRGQIVRTMSGGEQQMVAIGRAMMSNPALLTLDEPSLGLSPLLSKELFASLKAVRDAGIGILLVEQNARASLAIADRGYLIENGRILQEGRADALRSDPAVQAAYLGGAKSAKRGAPPAAPAPLAPASVPRPAAGPSPDQIAAAALASLAPPPARPVAAPMPAPEPPRVATPPAAPARLSTPSPAPRSSNDALPGGLSLADLVAQASDASRARFGSSQPAPPPAARPRAMPPPVTPTSTAQPQDRLKSVLSEIEEAAARARAWRPDPHRT